MLPVIYLKESLYWAVDFFEAHGIEYTKFDVAKDLAKRKEMMDKSGQMGVPVIDIDGKIVVGFNEDMIAGLLGI